MTFHGIFKDMVNESSFTKQKISAKSRIDEAEIDAYADTALGWHTRNNILSQIFGGTNNGLRIPAVPIKAGKKIPAWPDTNSSRKTLVSVYPFVGINGCALSPAVEAKSGHEMTYINTRLKNIERDFAGSEISVEDVLNKQVAEGTGIPYNVSLIFPEMPISSVGTGKMSKSMTFFNPAGAKKDLFRNNIYPYNIQQALSIDPSTGSLYPNPDKKGGVVLSPRGRSARAFSYGDSDAMMYLDRITIGDIMQMIPNRREFADALLGSNPKYHPSGTFMSCLQGNKWDLSLPDSNPSFGDFKSFIGWFGNSHKSEIESMFRELGGTRDMDGRKKNELLLNATFAAIHNWICETSANNLANNLIIPYCLASNFDNTYCWRLCTEGSPVSQEDIDVYNALTRIEPTGGSLENTIENMVDGDFETETPEEMGESVNYKIDSLDALKNLNESSDDSKQITVTTLGSTLFKIFDQYLLGHQSTIPLRPSYREDGTLRYNNEISSVKPGSKRTFVRIFSKTTEKTEMDQKISGIGDSFGYHGKLDYSPLFEQYSDYFVDASSAIQIIPFVRIVGYMVSFEYNPDLENAYKKESRSGKVRAKGLLEYYWKNEVPIRECTSFDVIYMRPGNGNDFIFSGYTYPKTSKSIGAPPPGVIENGLFADYKNGLHSVVVHDINRINLSRSWNTAVF